MVQSESLFDPSRLAGVQYDHTVLHDGSAVVVQANEARIVKSRVLFLVAGSAQLEGESRVLLHLGGGKGTAAVAGAAGASGLMAILFVIARLLLGRRHG